MSSHATGAVRQMPVNISVARSMAIVRHDPVHESQSSASAAVSTRPVSMRSRVRTGPMVRARICA